MADSSTAVPENPFIGAELLSAKERELCVDLGIMPKQYLLMKDALVRESFKQGHLTKTTACTLLSDLDQTKAGKLFDYFVVSGWVVAHPNSLV